LKAFFYPLVTVLLLIVAWHFAVIVFHIPTYLLPAPEMVLERLASDWSFILKHSWVTIYETIGGFLLSIVIGVPLAIILVASPTIDRALMPLLVLSQTFPKIALAPLIIIWFGLGLFPKLLVSFLVAFFPVLISTVVGMRAVEIEMLELARSMRASMFQIFWKFRIPFALPNLFAGMKVAIAFAIVGAIIGEWVGANQGLGYLLLQSNANLDTALLFSVLVVLLVLGVVFYYAVEWLERMLLPWHASVRIEGLQATI